MSSKARLTAEMVGEYNAGDMFKAANADMKRTAKQGKVLNNQFRIMRGGFGQMGHQVQDVAVQLQGGQNPFLILGQQGSQVASLFGPHGAVIGAVVAVGAAIASSMLPNLFGATKALQAVGKETEKLVDRFDELEGVLKQEAIRQVTQAIKDNNEAIADAEKKIEKLNRVEKAYADGQGAMTISIEEVTRRIHEQEKDIELLRESNVKLAASIDGTSDETEKLIEKLTQEAAVLGLTETEVIKLSDAYTKATASNQALIDLKRDEIDAHERAIEVKKREAKLVDFFAKENVKRAKLKEKAEDSATSDIGKIQESLMTEEQAIAHSYERKRDMLRNAVGLEVIDRDAARTLLDEINAHEDAAELERFEKRELALRAFLDKETAAKDKAAKEQEAIIRKKQQVEDMAMASASKLANQAMGMVDEQSGAAKALFAISQGLAIAQIIVETERAAAAAGSFGAALGGLPGFLASAGAVRAMGYASAGMVAGQTLASFEGGGLTGSGARSGGMDGKGGRLAVVHPNEKITDLHKGQGESKVVNVNFTIQANDTAGFDRLLNSRRSQIVNIINQAVNDRGRPSVA